MVVYRLAQKMAENEFHLNPEDVPTPQHPPSAEPNAAEGSSSDPSGLSPSQREVLERCLHALTHAKNDSHILAALLLVNNSLSSSSTLYRLIHTIPIPEPNIYCIAHCYLLCLDHKVVSSRTAGYRDATSDF